MIRVDYEITRDSSSEQTLWATIADLGVRKPIAHSKAPYVCGVIAQPDLNEPLYYRPLAYARIECGDADLRTWVSMDDGDYVLRLGEHEVQFYRFTTVDHSEMRQPLPPPRDCAGRRSRRVDMAIRHDHKGVHLAIPQLSIKHYFLKDKPDFLENWYCLSTLRRRAQSLDFLCSSHGTGVRARLSIDRDVLFLDVKDLQSMGDQHLYSRVGFELPCNAVPQFHGYDYLSPKYLNYPNNCYDRCLMRSARCGRDCDEKFSDAQGELDAAGLACQTQCRSKEEACSDRCSLQ